MYMQQKEAIYYLASKKCTWLVDSFILRSPWQVSHKVSYLGLSSIYHFIDQDWGKRFSCCYKHELLDTHL